MRRRLYFITALSVLLGRALGLLRPRLVLLVIAGMVPGAMALGASGAPVAKDYVPAELAPWVDWVRAKHPEISCPQSHANAVSSKGSNKLRSQKSAHRCTWVSATGVNVTDKGARFDMQVRLFAPGVVSLPGDAKVWPVAVMVDGRSAPVVRTGGSPGLQLNAGSYVINGAMEWVARPDSIKLPQYFGLLSVQLNGKSVSRPTVNGGRLFLGERRQAATVAAAATLNVDVFRQLIDDTPVQLRTFVRLQVAGPSRIETLGRVLLDDFAVTYVNSPLPARLAANGDLQVQVEPGEHLIEIGARGLTLQQAFTPQVSTPNWPEQEVWAFTPRRELRLVTLSGASGVDLSQLNTPFPSDGLQGYLLSAQQTLTLTEQQRGDPDPTPAEVQMSRDLWLNFAGDGFVIRDQLQARLRRAARLSAHYDLGSVTVNGRNQLVTRLAEGEPGVELDAQQHQVEAVSAVSRSNAQTAVGWNLDVSRLSATLHLPPGWRLLWVEGADSAPTSWLARWSLWDIFVVILSLVLAWRFFGKAFTGLLAVALLLVYQQSISLAVAWLTLLVLLLVVRYIEHQRLNTIARSIAMSVGILSLLGALGIAVEHSRLSLYPQLAQSGYGGVDFVHLANDSTAQTESMSDQVSNLGYAQPPSSPEDMSRQMQGQEIEEIVVTATKESPRRKGQPKWAPPTSEYPEGLQVQTGPGLPAWQWQRAPLVWHGPVVQSQPLQLTLMSPALVRIWHALVALLVLLVTALLLLPIFKELPPLPALLARFVPRVSAAAIVLGLGLGSALGPSGDVHAATPDPALLQELEQRLLQAPVCAPGCASLGKVLVRLSDRQLRLTVQIDAAALVAVPLPGSLVGWQPSKATLDGARAVLTTTRQGLMLAVPPGVHSLELEGALGALQQFELKFALPPAQVAIENSTTWQVRGLRNGRMVRNSLTFERPKPKAASAGDGAGAGTPTLQPDPAPAYVRVERNLAFGLDWRVNTQVRRVAPRRGSFTARVRLLPGESVLDERVNVSDGHAVLVFGANQNQVAWAGTIAKDKLVDGLDLVAPDIAAQQEVWRFQGSNLWHLHYQADAGLVASTVRGESGPVYFPRGGERLRVVPEATQALPGDNVTVHGVKLQLTPGERMLQSSLTLQIQASQGGDYELHIPPEAELTGVSINGQDQPISAREGRLELPLLSGHGQYELSWRAPTAQDWVFRTPALAVPTPVSNVAVNVDFPQDRWVLALGGPSLGPALLFWGVFIVVAVLGVLMTRVPNIPFKTWDALLLAIGLTLCNLSTALLVGIWVLLLRAKAQWFDHITSRVNRNTVQLLTAAVSVIAVLALVSSVPRALLGSPDMQVTGNGSSAFMFRWFADHAMAQLPTAWVLSLPLWVYRLAMLLWSLWLAFALVRWLRWAWETWSTPQPWYVVGESQENDKLAGEPEAAAAPPKESQ